MSSPHSDFDKALRHHRAGRLAEAEALYRQVLQHDPKNAKAWNNLGLIAAAFGKHAEGTQLLTKALELDSSSGDSNITRFNLAASLKSVDRRTEALALFQETWRREFGPGFASAGDFGVRELVRRLCTEPIGPWANRLDHLRAYAELIEEQGGFYGIESLLDEVRTSVALDDSNPTELEKHLHILLALGFLKTSDKRWNAKVFHTLALPWVKDALDLGHYDLALPLEGEIYDAYVRQTETEQHFRNCFNQWVPAMREAGQRVGASLPPVLWPDRDGIPVVGFFLHSASLLAHVEVLLNMLEGLAQLEAKPFAPRVYVFAGDYPPMMERIARLGVPVVLLDQSCAKAGKDLYQRLLYLREQLALDRVTALVWVSLAHLMPFAFALRLAPVQIWWAMKYHSLEFPEIDGYVTNSSVERYKRIDDRVWRAGRGAFPDLYDPDLQTEARRIRARYTPSFKYLLGCFGREEKLDQPEFIATVIQILQARLDAAFLWTGKVALPAVQKRLDAAGVGAQCFFIGWVDTKLYAQVIDIFLDSFPFPCGVTLIHAMAAGKPFVSCLSKECRETGTHGLFHALLYENKGSEAERRLAHEVFLGGKLYFCATHPEEYREKAMQLLADPDLREQAGSAARRFALQFFRNQRASAEGFAGHFLEIIAETRPV